MERSSQFILSLLILILFLNLASATIVQNPIRLNTNYVSSTVDNISRISYWCGKVNQHFNLDKLIWETDPDGTSGCYINKLDYCRKFYGRKIIGVKEYKNETITTWRNAGNRGGPYTSTKQSYECIREITPSVFNNENKKNMSVYVDREAFLISDENWKEVLSLVPLTTWTKQEGDNSSCQKGYGTPDNVCVYPTLIFHEESGERFADLVAGATITSFLGSIDSSASKAIDGNILTDWNSGSNSAGELKINLTETKQISRVDIFENAEPYFVTISVSENDITYQDVVINYTLTPGEGYAVFRNQIYFNPVNARYIKIILTDNPAQIKYPNWKTISEIKVYGREKYNYNSFDADSIIYFMQQYNPKKLTIFESYPAELRGLLTISPDKGAGLDSKKIQRAKINNYLSYWESYKEVVYVENDYELALMASTYASLLNAPLIIEGSNLDIDSTFKLRKVICVGEVSRQCNETYNLESLQKKYIDKTNTDKIILVNPDDLDISFEEEFQPDKSNGKFYELYTKTSLASPILASAKHELLLSTTETDYQTIDNFIKNTINYLMPEIINNSRGVLDSYYNWEFNKQIEYYIYGSLTIFASPNSIPLKKFSYYDGFGHNFSTALDPNKYADIFLEDSLPDLAVGRIYGITSSDVSSYLARDLFYDKLGNTNNVQFMAKDLSYMISHANSWTNNFKNAGYNATCNIINNVNYIPGEDFICAIDNSTSAWSNLWKNKYIISFIDHGGPYSAGISSSQIPYLSNSIVYLDACLTCSTYDSNSFCSNVIRKGGLGFIGAVSYSHEQDNTFERAIEGIFQDNLTLGQSFSKAYTYYIYYMDTLIGDPTFNLNPNSLLEEGLTTPW